ncbi:MAG: CxxC-x17-CxxC domain-containing protein [Chloroflexia bacterium]
MPDMSLTCRDCGQTFTFTEGEQDFYNSKGYTQPTRCPSCRATKKAARNSSDYSGGGGGYGDSYGSGGGYGGRRERQMTTVTCSNCGRDAEVPFVPSGDRPVYCSDCFSQMGGGSRGGGGGGGRGGSRY